MVKKFVLAIVILAIGYGGYIVYTDYAAGMYYLAGRYDRMMNPYGVDPEAPEPTAEETAFHQSMFIADMHADTLKWERDLLERSAFGHTDIPRMMEGNIALQGFTIVTKSPLRMPGSDCVSGRSPDTNTLLSAMQGRPIFDLKGRALYQVERFKDAVARSQDENPVELRLIETADDLEAFVQDRMAGIPVIGGILGVEGAHWIGGRDMSDDDVREEVRDLFDAGVRMFAPNHRFDNDLSGSSEGCEAHGLTDHGRVALAEAERLGMTIDLAHISPAGLRDAVDLLEQPFTISHTGIQAECDDPCRPNRNLSDEDIRIIVENDGLISVGFWPQAIGPSVWRLPEVMDHIKEITADLGREPGRHIALGSDYDGSVTPLIEAGHLDILTALMRRGPAPFDHETIRDINGRNSCRLFATTLPGGSVERAEAMCSELGHQPPTEAEIAADGGNGDEEEDERDRGAAAPGSGAPGSGAPGSGAPGSGTPFDGDFHRAGWVATDLIAWIARTQSDMNHMLRGNLAGSIGNGWAGALMTILVGFAYGLLHAAGPGHGKFVVGAYFLSRPERPLRAVALSSAMAMLQALTAIAAVILLIVVAGSTMARLLNQAEAVEVIAYSLIALLGVSMLVRTMRHGTGCGHCAHHHNAHHHSAHHHDTHHHDGARKLREHPTTNGNLIAMAIAVGLRPCTGALILLLFTLSQGAFLVGIVATLAMGMGVALTVSLSALGAIGVRRGVNILAQGTMTARSFAAAAPIAGITVQIAAALTIMTAGTLFAMAAFLRMGIL
jgi:membrane dipeptidase